MLKVSIAILVVALTHVIAASPTPRISEGVIKSLKGHGTADVILNMRQKTSTILQQIKLQSFLTRGERGNAVASSLKSFASNSQKLILDFLATQNVKVKSYWISNQISVLGANTQLINKLVTMDDIESIIENRMKIVPFPKPNESLQEIPKSIQWGVEMVEAPAAWAQGFTGRGVVVGILDTGVRYTHRTLYPNYRSERGWLDVTGAGALTPVDYGGHGTHVMGSIVGKDGVGVAPDAQWIACGATLTGYTQYLECAEFLLCPTHANGTEPECAAAPHIVSHSWGKLPSVDEDFLDSAIEAWNAAGIHVVWANGNEGRTCGSVRYPANTAIDMFTVGATDSDDTLAYFSSRGPGKYSGALKPNIAAPGVSIISASFANDESLTSMSGTSMAAPHAAGMLALLLTNGTELSYGELSSIVFEGAARTVPPTGGDCGGIPETEYPNNAVGHGRISATGSIARLLELKKLM